MVQKSGQLDLSSVLSGITRVTDGQTDGQTKRQTEFSSLCRVCITCSAVKMYRDISLMLYRYCIEI